MRARRDASFTRTAIILEDAPLTQFRSGPRQPRSMLIEQWFNRGAADAVVTITIQAIGDVIEFSNNPDALEARVARGFAELPLFAVEAVREALGTDIAGLNRPLPA